MPVSDGGGILTSFSRRAFNFYWTDFLVRAEINSGKQELPVSTSFEACPEQGEGISAAMEESLTTNVCSPNHAQEYEILRALAGRARSE